MEKYHRSEFVSAGCHGNSRLIENRFSIFKALKMMPFSKQSCHVHVLQVTVTYLCCSLFKSSFFFSFVPIGKPFSSMEFMISFFLTMFNTVIEC